MVRSQVADFLIEEVVLRYARQRFKDKIFFLQAGLAGELGSPIRIVPPGEATVKGHTITIPLFKRIQNLVTRRDLTSVAAPADLKLEGDTREIPIIRRKVGPVAKSIDVHKLNTLTPEEYSAELGSQFGEDMFKDMQGVIFKVINAIIGLTFSSVSHLLDQYEPFASVSSDDSLGTVANTMSMGLINKGQSVLGDSSGELTTIVMRSEAREDLRNNHFKTGYDSIAGHAAVGGGVRTVGMGEPIIMNLTEFLSANPSGSRTGSGSGTGTASSDKHRAYLFAPNSVELTIPHDLEVWTEGLKLDSEAPFLRFLGNYDFGTTPIGVGWKTTSPDNPTDAQLLTTSNWEDVTADDREVGIVVIEHNLVSQP